MLKHRQTCRVCDNPHLEDVIDLGDQYFQGCFVKDGVQPPPKLPMPNKVVRCDTTKFQTGCGLVQTAHSIDTDLLYCNYWYESGISQTMRDHLKSIVNTSLDITGISSGTVLDIASNDNTLLRNYSSKFNKIGIDPSVIAARQTDKDIKVINTTFPSTEVNKLIPHGTADIITSIACYYDIEDPVNFAGEIKYLLGSKGIWVFEVAYWKSLLDNLAYDSIVNEHIVHYHLAPLQYIMKYAGLKLFDVQKTPTNGGSIMCYVTHEDNADYDTRERQQRILNLKISEYEACLDQDTPYIDFRSKVEKHKEELTSLVNNIVHKEGKVIHICGASTKLNTILNYCDIGPDLIDFIVDTTPIKQNTLTPGKHIPVLPYDAFSPHPDVSVLFAWNHKKEILSKESNFSGQWITHLYEEFI